MIHKISQFLLINSEAISESSIINRVSLIYYLFEYANKYSKELCSEFSFELLEDILTQELSNSEESKDEESINTPILGWVLIRFIDKEYFESDDIEAILSIIDETVFKTIERLSRSEFETDYFFQLLLTGLYLRERILLIDKKVNSDKFLEVKEFLLISYFEISLNMNQFPLNETRLLGLFDGFLKESSKHEIIASLCLKALNKIDKLISKNIENTIINHHTSLVNKKHIESVLVYNLLFPNITNKNNANFNLLLFENIHNYTEQMLKALYKDNDNKYAYCSRLLMSCILSINKDKIEHDSIAFYLLSFSLIFLSDE